MSPAPATSTAASSAAWSAFLDELRARALLHDVIGRYVQWDRGKSRPSRRDWWACCPFHNEKSPSFHADDGKGFYHCFGCGASGDVLRFVMEKENLGFRDAVEKLAGDVGLAMPPRSPGAARRSQEHAGLIGVLERAAQWFQAQLQTTGGGAARSYLERRGVTADLIGRFGLGCAPRTGLLEHLRTHGIAQEQAVKAGLAATPKGEAPYPWFRNRIMFPITDPRGRVIAFGARALDPQARAKYLNSPETPLFHKSDVLFNLAAARPAAHEAGTVLVVEGYMDVVGLARAGLNHAVAPMGTALTRRQLELLWRLAPEPVICLDGDRAGREAARRIQELALPLLAPGRSLRFALLPEGRDPDDVVSAGGAEALLEIIGQAVPLVDMLWEHAVDAGPHDTPERRAAMAQDLRRAVAGIGDRHVRAYYAEDVRRRLDQLFGASPPAPRWQRRDASGPGGGGWHGGKDWHGGKEVQEGRGASQALRRSVLARSGGVASATRTRIQLLLCLIVRFPRLAADHAEELAHLEIDAPELAAMRETMLTAAPGVSAPDLRDLLQQQGLDGILRRMEESPDILKERLHRPELDLDQAAQLWRHTHARHVKMTAQAGEHEAVARDFAEQDATSERIRAFQDDLFGGAGSESHFE